jgi:hypothetical protein
LFGIREFLYLLDWLRGQEWAFDYLTDVTQAEFRT